MDMNRTNIKEALKKNGEVTVVGWVHDSRDLSKVRFIVLKDATGKIQITGIKRKTPDKTFALMDNITKESVIEEYRRFFPQTSTLSLMQLLNKLEKSFSLHDKTIAAHLKAKLKMPNWKQSLREQIKSCDGPFHQYAYELLES